MCSELVFLFKATGPPTFRSDLCRLLFSTYVTSTYSSVPKGSYGSAALALEQQTVVGDSLRPWFFVRLLLPPVGVWLWQLPLR
jgi:hypothetical protein